MAMHTRSVVTENRLRHEGSTLAVLIGYILYDIFIDLNFVGFLGEGVEFGGNFVLSACCNFMMMSLNLKAELFHDKAHC